MEIQIARGKDDTVLNHAAALYNNELFHPNALENRRDLERSPQQEYMR